MFRRILSNCGHYRRIGDNEMINPISEKAIANMMAKDSIRRDQAIRIIKDAKAMVRARPMLARPSWAE